MLVCGIVGIGAAATCISRPAFDRCRHRSRLEELTACPPPALVRRRAAPAGCGQLLHHPARRAGAAEGAAHAGEARGGAGAGQRGAVPSAAQRLCPRLKQQAEHGSISAPGTAPMCSSTPWPTLEADFSVCLPRAYESAGREWQRAGAWHHGGLEQHRAYSAKTSLSVIRLCCTAIPLHYTVDWPEGNLEAWVMHCALFC